MAQWHMLDMKHSLVAGCACTGAISHLLGDQQCLPTRILSSISVLRATHSPAPSTGPGAEQGLTMYHLHCPAWPTTVLSMCLPPHSTGRTPPASPQAAPRPVLGSLVGLAPHMLRGPPALWDDEWLPKEDPPFKEPLLVIFSYYIH